MPTIKWQTMDTAPQDGTRVLLANEDMAKDHMQTARFLDYAGVWAVFNEPDGSHVILSEEWPKFWRHLPS